MTHQSKYSAVLIMYDKLTTVNLRYFVGGNVLQRPALITVNGVIIGAFGGFCDLLNYTGMIVAVSMKPGIGITSLYAMEGGPGSQPETDDISLPKGGQAGIWQGGMSPAVDNSRIFLTTGKNLGLLPNDAYILARRLCCVDSYGIRCHETVSAA